MITSTPPDNNVLVLRPPIVNGQTRPVVGAHIGLPLVAYDLVTDGKGAVVLVDPPLDDTMDPGDVMELWLEGESAALDSKTIEDPDVRTTLRIPKGRLHPDKVNVLYYTIRRGSNNRGESTPLEILYNRIRPGLKDRYDAPGGHSELELLLPDVIRNGVDPDFVDAQVSVSYPYCRAYDSITLKCNGEQMTVKVKPTEAPPPPNPGSEVPITIHFTVDRAFLDKAKRLDQKLHFSYTVTDQIGNGPDTDAPWSPVQTVDEDLDGTRLPMPILLERKEDFPGDDASIIDLEKLAGNPLLIVVMTADNRFVVGDDVIATYTATNTGQPGDVVIPVSGKVEADPFGAKKTLFLEVANDKVFAGSDVTVTYELRRSNGDLVANSNTAKATVTGTNPIELLPPFLVAPAVDPIDVLAYPNGVTVRIEYLQALDGDKARLVEVNPPVGAPPFPLEPFNTNKQVNTVLSQSFLAARHGQMIELYWNLHRDDVQAGKSLELKLTILKLSAAPVFVNEPYLIAASGRLKDVVIRIGTETEPVANAKVALALPAGFSYSDGGTGTRDFITDASGLVTISRIKGSNQLGEAKLAATFAERTVTANVVIQGQGPLGGIRMRSRPLMVAVSHDGTRAYATLGLDASIGVIDTQTNQLITYLSTGYSCKFFAVSQDDTVLYVNDSSNGTVSFHDAVTGDLIKTVNTTPYLRDITLNPSGTELHVSHGGGNETISLINTATGAVRSVAVPGSPAGGAFTNDGKLLYVCIHTQQSFISIIDTESQKVIENIQVAKGPSTCVLSPDNRHLYVVHSDAAQVSVIDTASKKVLRTLNLDDPAEYIAISANGAYLYISLLNKLKIAVINTTDFTFHHYIPATGMALFGLAITPDDSQLYVCSFGTGMEVQVLQATYSPEDNSTSE